jgi:hypothetical protein
MQLTSPSGNSWDAAAWTGLQRSSANPLSWVDGAGAAAGNIRWCPGEPNNKNGEEGCAALLTACSDSSTALVNDFPCSRALRVLCAFEAATECPESWTLFPSQGSPGGSCKQQVRGVC